MRAARCHGLSWVLGMASLFIAPACLAQQASRPVPPDGVEVDALVEQARADRDTAERSAFGRVMSIMIAALTQNADKPPQPQHAAAPTAPDAAVGEPPRDIELGAAFRLDSAPARPTALPATASID